MRVPYIPKELLNIILEYDGRIKYRNGEYVNVIHKHDERYSMIGLLLNKKKWIMDRVQLSDNGFYFEFGFDICNAVGLCYDYNYSYAGEFEICYVDTRNGDWKQIRTYL